MSHNGSSGLHQPVDVMRHSAAHVLAKAVQRLYPGSKFGIGPVIENGFYYDIDVPQPLSEADLPRIEEEMRKIIANDEPFERVEWSKGEALAHYSRVDDNPYKREIVDDVPDGEALSFYRTGDEWIDLCRGPHVPSAGKIGPFKLLGVSGAYWRGNEKRPMLQRIYGTAWPTQEQLDHYLWQLEEAKRRDHRKLGRELELFFFDEVAPGQPFWLPKGMAIIQALEALLQQELDRRAYVQISTPSLVKAELWKQSGHWENYRENMFALEVEETEYALKPMNCPESTIVFRARTRSYRDLPLRLAQTDRLLRNERSGTLNGLLRVRQLTMDDAHIYCRPDQVQAEISGILDLGNFLYDIFGFQRRYSLSTRPEKAIGDAALWDEAEGALRAALEQHAIPYEVKPGEGAFYGPKIDVDIQDALGRAWQLATIQLDYQSPQRFGLEYFGEDGRPHRPVIIHRAIYGTYERFVAILIEHFGGAFPLWLAPVQAVVVPIADRHVAYARVVAEELRARGFRVEVDSRREKMQAKIRDAQTQQVPYMLVVGDRDEAAGTIAVRERRAGDLGAMPRAELLAKLEERRAART